MNIERLKNIINSINYAIYQFDDKEFYDINIINFIINEKLYNNYEFIVNYRLADTYYHKFNIINFICNKINNKNDKINFIIDHKLLPSYGVTWDDIILYSIYHNKTLKYNKDMFKNASIENLKYVIKNKFNVKMIYYCNNELYEYYIECKKAHKSKKTKHISKKLILFLNKLSKIKRDMFLNACTIDEKNKFEDLKISWGWVVKD